MGACILLPSIRVREKTTSLKMISIGPSFEMGGFISRDQAQNEVIVIEDEDGDNLQKGISDSILYEIDEISRKLEEYQLVFNAVKNEKSEKNKRELRALGEGLMQSLEWLDSLQMVSTGTREARKEQVRNVQKLLNSVDKCINEFSE